MADLGRHLGDNRTAVLRFLETACTVPAATWDRPPGSGRWSPAQVAEHVAVTMEQAARIMADVWDGPVWPRPLRPLARMLAFQPVLRAGRFKYRVRTLRSFEPTLGGVTQAGAEARLMQGLEQFEAAVRRLAIGDEATFEHPMFGRVAFADYVRFNAIHVAHHERQLAPA